MLNSFSLLRNLIRFAMAVDANSGSTVARTLPLASEKASGLASVEERHTEGGETPRVFRRKREPGVHYPDDGLPGRPTKDSVTAIRETRPSSSHELLFLLACQFLQRWPGVLQELGRADGLPSAEPHWQECLVVLEQTVNLAESGHGVSTSVGLLELVRSCMNISPNFGCRDVIGFSGEDRSSYHCVQHRPHALLLEEYRALAEVDRQYLVEVALMPLFAFMGQTYVPLMMANAEALSCDRERIRFSPGYMDVVCESSDNLAWTRSADQALLEELHSLQSAFMGLSVTARQEVFEMLTGTGCRLLFW